MNKKFCLSNDIFNYLFKTIETSPDASFYESELRSYADFDMLCKKKYLKWVQYDPENEPYYSARLGDNGNERFVRRVNGKIYAYSTEDSTIARIELKQEDINRWYFDIQTLLQEIKKTNALSGHVNQIDERLYFIGEFDSGSRQFGVCLGLFADDAQVKSLIGLRQRIKHCESVLVLCLTYEIIDQGLLSSLEKQKVFCFPFLKIFKRDSLQIDFDLIKVPVVTEVKFIIPELSATEKRKYAKDYPRKDIVEFTDREAGLRRYVVLVNSKVVEMPYGLLVLFLYLAIALKQERNLGWISTEDLEKEGILDADNITHLHRMVSDLKKLIKFYIEDNGTVELIENIKKKSKYRLSTMPSRIKAPHAKWLAATYNKIKIEVLKERQKRKAKVDDSSLRGR